MKHSVDFSNSDRWNSLRDLISLQKGVHNLINEFVWPNLHQNLSALPGARPSLLSSEVEETDSVYVLSFDLPGVKKEDLKIEICGDHLMISGERRDDSKEVHYGSHFSDHRRAKFNQTFTIPTTINSEKIEANFQDGVLRIYFPKTGFAKTKEIKISERSTQESSLTSQKSA